MDPDPVRELAKLRKFRNRPAADLSIAAALASVQKELVNQVKRASGIGAVWEATAPAELRSVARVERLTPAGMLTLTAADAAARYQLELWLRSGGLGALQRASTAPIRRIKIGERAPAPRRAAAQRGAPAKSRPATPRQQRKRPGGGAA